MPDELKHVPLNDFGESSLPFCGDVRASPDRQALELLYFATDGPNWTNNCNWLSDRPVREWEGVNTNAAAGVTEINLAENGLEGVIPVEIGSLTAMMSLVLWNNRLSGSVPAEIGGLVNLEKFHVGGNQLTGGIPPELGQLSEPTHL